MPAHSKINNAIQRSVVVSVFPEEVRLIHPAWTGPGFPLLPMCPVFGGGEEMGGAGRVAKEPLPDLVSCVVNLRPELVG